ncbi:MAG: hypothetical protein B1H13_11395 [Desulfobacteraceae bacterium 4484_190.3]|nr:MAG: hypothetical protein B1H13_11395 [Desulfobacteraceae bacterium 4484_190.3]
MNRTIKLRLLARPPVPVSTAISKTAEGYILASLEKVLGCSFNADAVLPVDIGVRPDAVDLENKIVVEVYARVGEVKGGQLHKIKGDVLKLALIDKRLGPGWRKIICFASDEAAKYIKGKSWVAEAAREFNIEVYVVELPVEQMNKVISAQHRQRMVNPS